MKILKEILQELILIRKELQAIRSNLESHREITIEGKELAKAVQKSIRDTMIFSSACGFSGSILRSVVSSSLTPEMYSKSSFVNELLNSSKDLSVICTKTSPFILLGMAMPVRRLYHKRRR